MDIEFQDRIDNYLLHGDRMSDEERAQFLQEIEQDAEKKEQFELTKCVKDRIASREDKLRLMADFRKRYEEDCRVAAMRPTGSGYVMSEAASAPRDGGNSGTSRRRVWWWISGIAAILVAGFFVIRPQFMYESTQDYRDVPTERMRGGDGIFDGVVPTDTVSNDTVTGDVDIRE